MTQGLERSKLGEWSDVSGSMATKGDDCTFKLPFRIRMSDKLYKIMEA